jgi:FAD linked oxidases, C-terminal domain
VAVVQPGAVVGAFGDLVLAGHAVAEVTRRGLAPAVMEILDRACLEAVEEWKQLGLEADALWVEQSTDDAEAEALFGADQREGMRRELDPGSLALQDAVRQALDPLGIFNPGKG